MKPENPTIILADRDVKNPTLWKVQNELAFRLDAERRVEYGVYARLDDRIEDVDDGRGVFRGGSPNVETP